jgi:acyl-CoA-associated DUF35 OB-fold domain-containing protein
VIETIAASRCPRCGTVVAPPAEYCPRHPVAMTPITVPGTGEIVTFTTLHSPPEGFRSPLHLAVVELDAGAQLVCHGAETRGVKIGARVGIEAVNSIYYFSHLGTLDRARLFWRRAGRAGERVNAIAKSLVKRAARPPAGAGGSEP